MIWRTGSKNGRVVYEQRNTEPSDDDKPIGMMDTAALAAHVVEAVNAWDATDEPGKYEARCECGHPSKEHHYKNGCEHITREAGGWRNCVCMNNSDGQDYRDVRAAEYTNAPPILCPDCEHSQNMHLHSKWIGCTKVEYLSSGDWASDCPCMLTYDQITARLKTDIRPDMEEDVHWHCLNQCGLFTGDGADAHMRKYTGHYVSRCHNQPCLAKGTLREDAGQSIQHGVTASEWHARLAAHDLAEDEPMPASCLLGRCAHDDRADLTMDPTGWFTRDELAGIAGDGVNRMERADNLSDEAPKIAEVAARPQRWTIVGDLINEALMNAAKRENPLTGRREPEVQIIDDPVVASEMSEELRAMLHDWATRVRDETGRWPITTGWIKDAVEQVLPEVQEYFEAEMRDAALDPTGITVSYDMSPLRPKPIVDVELPEWPEYRDPDAYTDNDGHDICRKCGTQAMSFGDGGWACDCDSAMFEHMRPEATDGQD